MSGRQLDNRPSATTIDLEDLVESAWAGEVRVPRFQRDFRWGIEDVLRLFDSIAMGYPIGSLLLWLRPANGGLVRLGAIEIVASPKERALWVVDGQQRITSLANALFADGSTDPRFAVSFDLRENKFRAGVTHVDPWVVPLPVIFDLQKLLRYFSNYPEAAQYFDVGTALAKTLRQYKIPAYEVTSADESTLRDIFDRMNNFGKRLSRAEVFAALYAGEAESGDLSLERIAQNVEESQSWGRIDADTILRAVLARRGPDVTREIRTEFDLSDRRSNLEFPGEGRLEAYQAAEKAIVSAVAFLRDSAGIPHISLLPYRYILIVVARFYAHFPQPHPRNATLLRRWVWRAALAGPGAFKGSATGAMRALANRVQPGDESGSVQALLSVLEPAAQPVPEVTRTRTNEASTKIVLCAMWDLGPRSFVTGERFTTAQLNEYLRGSSTVAAAVHDILPRANIERELRLSSGNRLLLPEPIPDSRALERILVDSIDQFDPDERSAILAAHALGQAVSYLREGQLSTFVRVREEVVQQQVEGFLQTKSEWGFEDTPPLDSLEFDD